MSLQQLADRIYMALAAMTEGKALGLAGKAQAALDSQGHTTRPVERNQVEDVSARRGWK